MFIVSWNIVVTTTICFVAYCLVVGRRERERASDAVAIADHKRTDAVRILQQCTAQPSPALVISSELGVACPALFTSVSDSSVTLDVFTEEDIIFGPASLCCVSFSHQTRAYIFLSPVLEFGQNQPSNHHQLVLTTPPEIAKAERRTAFRVPVRSTRGLHVQVTTQDGRVLNAEPRNLSLTGIWIRFAAYNDPNLSVGARMNLELSLGKDVAQMTGEVRRRQNRSYGVFFPEVLNKGSIEPPESFRSIFTRLNQQWLRGRIETRSEAG